MESKLGGVRDLAEKLSQNYILHMYRLNEEPAHHMSTDLDLFVTYLEQLDPVWLTTSATSEYGQAFLMGLMHQVFAVEGILDDADSEEEAAD